MTVTLSNINRFLKIILSPPKTKLNSQQKPNNIFPRHFKYVNFPHYTLGKLTVRIYCKLQLINSKIVSGTTKLLKWATVWPQQTWVEKRGAGLLYPFRGSWVLVYNTMWPGPRSTYLPSGILIHPAVWPQQTWTENWGLCPLGGAGSPSITMCPCRGLPPCQVPSWSIQPFGHNTRMSQTWQTDRQDNGPRA